MVGLDSGLLNVSGETAVRHKVVLWLGLALLYSSGYFMPMLTGAGAYFLPSGDFFRLIVLPSGVGVLVITAACHLVDRYCQRLFSEFSRIILKSAFFAFLGMIGIKGAFYAAGYDWRQLIPTTADPLETMRYVKYLGFVIAAVLVWLNRRVLKRTERLLSSVGFAFGALALLRLGTLWAADNDLGLRFGIESSPHLRSSPVVATLPSEHAFPNRRVVWVIFDETDFNRTFTGQKYPALVLNNFLRLSRQGVFAVDANSPASATLYSVPALLTGIPVTGKGNSIDSLGHLSQQTAGGGWVNFGGENNVFASLAKVGRSSAILGFYHPYCKLFAVARCDSFSLADPADFDAALWANVPDFITERTRLARSDAITAGSLALLPGFLNLDQSLTFLHLNLPHLPAHYADSALHLKASRDPLEEYAHNLLLTDQVLGQIMEKLEKQGSGRETLLVVSTDHWLRTVWYAPTQRESSHPIPFIVWKVGDLQGAVIREPLSTIHTAAMVLDYLNGSISTQDDVVRWWSRQKTFPSFIAPRS